MIYIKARQDTALTKKPFQSSHKDNTSSPVPKDRTFAVESYGKKVGGKQEVNLAFGAGTWWVYPPHWLLPDPKFKEKYTSGHEQFKRYDLPNTKEGNVQRIILTAKEFECRKNQVAYLIATARWETGGSIIPNKEAYWLSEDWRRRNLRYYPFFGRGLAHITWKNNYQKYEDLLGLPLVSKPNLALDPDVATFILVHGSMTGIFTGVSLPDYVNGRRRDYYNARRVINGLDKAQTIANIADAWFKGETLKDY